MKITVVYDNEVRQPGLKSDWGFSCLIEAPDIPQILFDTGASGSILLHNMRELGLDPSAIRIVVLSHPHWDHVGGLSDFLQVNKEAEIYPPASLRGTIPGRKVSIVREPVQICPNVFTTSELKGIEQSLAVDTDRGILAVVGCSHPGVVDILDAASKFGKVYGIIGGFHRFHDFKRLEGLSLICPCHCTSYKSEIKRRFPQQCIECGAGVVLEL